MKKKKRRLYLRQQTGWKRFWMSVGGMLLARPSRNVPSLWSCTKKNKKRRRTEQKG